MVPGALFPVDLPFLGLSSLGACPHTHTGVAWVPTLQLRLLTFDGLTLAWVIQGSTPCFGIVATMAQSPSTGACDQASQLSAVVAKPPTFARVALGLHLLSQLGCHLDLALSWGSQSLVPQLNLAAARSPAPWGVDC